MREPNAEMHANFGEVRPDVELLSQAERVSDHLLRQIDTNNPLLVEPHVRFEAATIVAKFNGNERAFDIAWNTVENLPDPEGVRPYDLEKFARAAIKYHGAEGITEAREIASFIPDSDKELIRPQVLTCIVESTDNDDIKRSATQEALELLNRATTQGSRRDIFDDPPSLLLRLGIANRREDLIDQAVKILDPATLKFRFMEEVARGLKEVGDMQDLRASLVQAAITAQGTGVAYPATVVRCGFRELLNEPEMKELLGAIHRDGRQRLHDNLTTLLDHPSAGVSVTNGREMVEFNKLASAFDTWVSPQEHGRFALKALSTRIREKWRGEGSRRMGNVGTAAYMAKKVMEAIEADPALHDAETIDDVLEHFYLLHDEAAARGPRGRMYGLWAFGVKPDIRHGRISEAQNSDVETIYTLRNSLPYASAARIELNAALAKSGDRAALIDSANALTHDPEGLLTRPIRQKENGGIVKRPYLYPYEWLFFDLVKKV